MANTCENYVARVPDHFVSLTETGKAQARQNGEWLANYCKHTGMDTGKPKNCWIREIDGNRDLGYINKDL